MNGRIYFKNIIFLSLSLSPFFPRILDGSTNTCSMQNREYLGNLSSNIDSFELTDNTIS